MGGNWSPDTWTANVVPGLLAVLLIAVAAELMFVLARRALGADEVETTSVDD
jgi:hypothetical protein